MAVTYVSSSGYGVATLGTANLPVPKPTGVQVGDLLIATMSSDGPTVGAPAGWTQHANSIGDTSKLWWRVATSDDVSATSYTFTRANNIGIAVATIVALRGARSTTPIEAVAGTQANGAASVNVGSVTATNARYLLTMVTNFGSASYTPPASQTEAFDYTTPQNHPVRTAGGYDTSPVAAGVTGTRTWTSSASADHRAYNILVISGLHTGTGSTSSASQLTASGARLSSGAGSTSAASTLGGSGNSSRSGWGGISNVHTLTASGHRVSSGAGSASAISVGTGSGSTQRTGSGSVAATSSVTGDGFSRGSTGALEHTSALSASGIVQRSGIADLAVSALLAGSGRQPLRDLTFTAQLDPAGHSAELVASPRSARLAPPSVTARLE